MTTRPRERRSLARPAGEKRSQREPRLLFALSKKGGYHGAALMEKAALSAAMVEVVAVALAVAVVSAAALEAVAVVVEERRARGEGKPQKRMNERTRSPCATFRPTASSSPPLSSPPRVRAAWPAPSRTVLRNGEGIGYGRWAICIQVRREKEMGMAGETTGGDAAWHHP